MNFHRARGILFEQCNMDVNLGKLAAWSKAAATCPDGLDVISPTAWKSDRSEIEKGVKVLGTPLGSREYIERVSVETIEEKAQLLHFIPKLPSIQAGWLLLYFCAVPRINHLLRTVPPNMMRLAAAAHDTSILGTFALLFDIPSGSEWNQNLHNVTYENWERQARLPLRLSGCGLRNSLRTSSAAYWASWADCLKGICDRFPAIGARVLHRLNVTQAAPDPNITTFQCIQDVELAGRWCDARGWEERPSWIDLAAGLRPPTPPPEELHLGEWQHGWQYHASNAAERWEFNELLQALAFSQLRRNAASAGKARLHSCMGRFAASWLTVAPCSASLHLSNIEFNIAVRRRLGIAVAFEGPDAHGHAALATNVGARLNARHTGWLCAWRQVFHEAGGQVPDRNVERMLRNTHIPVPAGDTRRLDLIVPGLNVAQGRPLFCDVTVLSPLTGTGVPRGGTSNRGGGLLEGAERENNRTYHEVHESGLGALYCLGSEVFGRWSRQCVQLIPELARERSRYVHIRLRKSTALSLQRRWAGILAVGLQRAVSHIVAHSSGADLVTTQLEPAVSIADLI